VQRDTRLSIALRLGRKEGGRLKVFNADKAGAAGVMLATLVGVAAMSQVFRTIAAIVAPGLQREFGLSTEELGIYAGAFHLSFALAQIPMGLALDLYGVRKTVGSAFLLAVAGALLSFIATGFPVLMLGQLLIGIGCAPAFVGSLFFVSKHFSEKSFARVSGLVLSFSGLGLLATGTPLAWVVEHWGWRSAFVVTGVVAAANLVCILVLVRDDHGKNSGDIAGAIRETLAILKERQTKGIVALALVAYPSYIALRGLWATPLFMERHGFTLTGVGNVLLASSVATLVGPPLFGLVRAKGRSRRYLICASMATSAGIFLILAISANWIVDATMCVALGALTGFTILQFADTKSAYDPQVVGRAFGILNTAAFLGVAISQGATGWVASTASTFSVNQFAAVFAFIAAACLLAMVAFFMLPWPEWEVGSKTDV
jgi:predicted MFS family arabinose efflux permease